MFNLADDSEDLLLSIENSIRTNVNIETKVLAVVCYGSRVAGCARLDSDVDLLVVVSEVAADFYREMHGSLIVNANVLPIECRIYSLEKLNLLLNGEDLKRLFALKNCVVLKDSENLMKKFISDANSKFSKVMLDFENQLKALDVVNTRSVLKIAMSEALTICENLMRTGQNVSAYGKVIESIIDYLISCESFFLNQGLTNEEQSILPQLYFLYSDKGARFFDINKYSWPARYESLLVKLNCCFIDGQIVNALREICNHHRNYFGEEILIDYQSYPLVTLS